MYLTFEVNRCTNTSENKNWCHPDYEIDEYLAKASIETWTIEKRVDMNKYYEEPSYCIMELHDKKLLNQKYLQSTDIKLVQSNIDSINGWFNVDGTPTYSLTYYTTYKINQLAEHWMDNSKGTLTRTKVYLQSLKRSNSRQVYGFIDLLGDLGGVLEVIMVFTGAIFLPISEHHYTLQATKRMFMVRSQDSSLF